MQLHKRDQLLLICFVQATCSKDGTVRIYEAPDIMNLGQWQLQVSGILNCLAFLFMLT